jgi:hypothetical protein
MNLFSNPPMDKPARRGKSAYLRDDYHERIRQIVNALNIEGVNISSYVDMVLTDHLMRYEAQIDHCCTAAMANPVNWPTDGEFLHNNRIVHHHLPTGVL